jgi:hypothetical protein
LQCLSPHVFQLRCLSPHVRTSTTCIRSCTSAIRRSPHVDASASAWECSTCA